MKINTKNFGKLDVNERNILTFEDGLMGMEDVKRFTFINNTDTEGPVPFMWLQGVDDPDIAFVLTIPYLLRDEYEVEIPDEIVESLMIQDAHDVAVYTTVTVARAFSSATMNLQSPLIINTDNNKAAQVIMHDSGYSCKERCLNY